MKAILEFDLPEDQAEFDNAVLAGTMYSAIHDVANQVRSQLKHGAPETDREVLQRVFEQLYDIIDKLDS